MLEFRFKFGFKKILSLLFGRELEKVIMAVIIVVKNFQFKVQCVEKNLSMRAVQGSLYFVLQLVSNSNSGSTLSCIVSHMCYMFTFDPHTLLPWRCKRSIAATHLSQETCLYYALPAQLMPIEIGNLQLTLGLILFCLCLLC